MNVYAGFWKRLFALLMDWIVFGVISFPVFFLIGLSMADMPEKDINGLSALAQVLSWVFYLIYRTTMESSKHQATLGKMAIGIKVTDMDGGRLSFGQALARHVSKLISIIPLYLGFVFAGFTEKKQALHDMVAGTLVVNK